MKVLGQPESSFAQRLRICALAEAGIPIHQICNQVNLSVRLNNFEYYDYIVSLIPILSSTNYNYFDNVNTQ